MGLFPFFGVTRRVRRWAFVLLVIAAVYAGPRFARDMINSIGPESTTSTSLP